MSVLFHVAFVDHALVIFSNCFSKLYERICKIQRNILLGMLCRVVRSGALTTQYITIVIFILPWCNSRLPKSKDKFCKLKIQHQGVICTSKEVLYGYKSYLLVYILVYSILNAIFLQLDDKKKNTDLSLINLNWFFQFWRNIFTLIQSKLIKHLKTFP